MYERASKFEKWGQGGPRQLWLMQVRCPRSLSQRLLTETVSHVRIKHKIKQKTTTAVVGSVCNMLPVTGLE